MKKNIFGIAVAALAMLSACERHEPQVEPAPETNKEQVILTASIGAETKTFLEQVSEDVFKVRWAEDDDIILYDLDIDYSLGEESYEDEDYYGYFEIQKGIGESSAEFVLDEGHLPDRYLAIYGDIWPEENGQWMVWAPKFQGLERYETKSGESIVSFEGYDYPMYAIGSGSDIQFKNLFSVLKLNIKGNGEQLNLIKVSSLDEGIWLAGDARIDFSASKPVITFSKENVGEYEVDVYDYINLDPKTGQETREPAVLSDEPIECYVVLPAQTYTSGLKITLTTSDGYMEVTTDANLKFEVGELREIPAFEYQETVSYAGEWTLRDDNYEMPIIMTEENGYYVIKNYYSNGSDLWIEDGEGGAYGWYVEGDDYYGTYQRTNVKGLLQKSTRDNVNRIRLISGYYDFYLDAENECLYVMDAGMSPADLPTGDYFVCNDYYTLRETRYENNPVKVWGYVVAVYTRGFIIELGNNGNKINVYTFDSENLSSEMKAELDGVEVGDRVELYATNTTYFSGLPELADVIWIKVHNKENIHIYSDSPYSVTEHYENDYYSYISMSGILSTEGSAYIIVLDEEGCCLGNIFFPTQNMEEYIGKQILVHGFYVGTDYAITEDDQQKSRMNIVATKIMVPNIDGSTEDVIPDDDIVVPAL